MIKPLRNLILIAVKRAEKTEGGIFLPDADLKERPATEGIVEEIGDRVEDVKVGNKVLFIKYGHTVLEGQDKIILSEEDILALIT